jgi:hypothetical protein
MTNCGQFSCNTIGDCVHQIHIDTGATYSSNANPILKNSGNSFDCSVMLNHVHRNVRRIALKNVQMPIGFYNIRSPYNSFTITPANTGTPVTYTVTPGNYNLTTLLNTINNLVTPSVGVFSVGSLTNMFQYVPAAGVGSVTLTGTLLSPLGFTSGQSGTSIVATNSYIINFDTYVYLYFPDFGTSSKENTLGTFKIPINVASGSILQWGDNAQNEQFIIATDKSKFIDRIIVKVIDRYGNLMNNNGIDWSFTLEIVSDA